MWLPIKLIIRFARFPEDIKVKDEGTDCIVGDAGMIYRKGATSQLICLINISGQSYIGGIGLYAMI